VSKKEDNRLNIIDLPTIVRRSNKKEEKQKMSANKENRNPCSLAPYTTIIIIINNDNSSSSNNNNNNNSKNNDPKGC